MSEPSIEQQAGRVWDYLKGFHAVHLLAMGTETGLFAEIAKAGAQGLAPAALASQLRLHPPYIEVWCRTAYSYGFLESDDGERFRLAPHMDKLLVERADPRHLAPYVSTTVNHVADDLRRYPQHFRDGSVYRFQEHGADFSRHIGDTTAGFHTVIARRMLPAVPGLKARLEAGARVLDVGCGTGGLMLKIAQAWPKVSCLGVDNDPHGVEQAQKAIAASGLGERVVVELVGAEGIGHSNEFDAVTMFEVIHEIAAEHRLAVMRNVGQTLKPGGVFFAIDETYPSTLAELRDPGFGFAVQTQFNELVWGNIVPTREEQDRLFAAAGLVDVARAPVGGLFTLLTARKPG